MALEKDELYRLPWSMNDNPIAWLEITDICNIYCEGCYRQHMTGHKTLEQIKEEILFFKKWRNPDNVSIAGGEPLIHPQIIDIVAFIAQNGIKPVILTNAVALTPELLRELKKAGLAGFTIHIDSHQNRPHWKDKTEADLNELRQQVTDMVAAEGGLYLVFNSTVYPSTFHEIPDVVRWGQANFGRVHGLVFITYRTASTETNIGLAGGDHVVDLSKLSYTRERFDEKFVTSPEVYAAHQGQLPGISRRPATWAAASCTTPIKWLASARWSAPRRRSTARSARRRWRWRRPATTCCKAPTWPISPQAEIGRKIFLMSPWDKTVRQAVRTWWATWCATRAGSSTASTSRASASSRRPICRRDGRADMCDSCPDMTVLRRQADQLVPHGRVPPLRRLPVGGGEAEEPSSAELSIEPK